MLLQVINVNWRLVDYILDYVYKEYGEIWERDGFYEVLSTEIKYGNTGYFDEQEGHWCATKQSYQNVVDTLGWRLDIMNY